MSYEIQKHRTFQFADLPEEEFGELQNQCRQARMQPVLIETAGGGFELRGGEFLFGEEPPSALEIYESGGGITFTPIGRHDYLKIPRSKGEWFTAGQWKAIAYPDLAEREILGRLEDQDFEGHCTYWEWEYSPLIPTNDRNTFTPVVDQCGMVIGYYGRALDPKCLYVTPRGEILFAWSARHSVAVPIGSRPLDGEEVWLTSEGQVLGWVDGAQNLPPLQFSELYHERIKTGETMDLLVDIDGYVVAVNFRDLSPEETPMGRAIEQWKKDHPVLAFLLPTPPNPDDPLSMPLFFIETMFLVGDIMSLGQSSIARKALFRLLGVAARAGRYAHAGVNLLRAADRMETLLVRARMVPIGQDFQWARRSWFGNYFPQGGMPAEHFAAAQRAVDDMKKHWVLIRPTNQKSIEGIMKGFPPKSLDLKVKTSPTTGLVTCTTAADKKSAWEAGHLVVEKHGNGWRAVLRDPKSSDLKITRQVELKNTNWNLEEGQVLKADEAKPFVGDYDVFDVFEPARRGNVALAASEGQILKSWENPWTRDFIRRAYQGFDRPRMLHGAQAQFDGWVEVNGQMVQKKQLGGILDEPLLLLRPNQPAAWLPDKNVVETFYREMGRRTIGGN